MLPTLLDTDMLSEVIKLRDPMAQQRALDYTKGCGPLTFSATTRYEILRGYKQKKATRQLVNFATFCKKSSILPVTNAIWDRASSLAARPPPAVGRGGCARERSP